MKTPIVIVLVLGVLLGGYYVFKKDAPASPVPQNEQTEENQNTTTPVASGKTVDLSYKGLTKAPGYIFDLKGVEKLDLSHNSLDGSLQAEVRHLNDLKVLDLSDNKFTGVPAEVGQLKYLEVLDLSNNMLTGLPNELGNLSNLKILDLSGNNYSEADLNKIKETLPASTVIKVK